MDTGPLDTVPVGVAEPRVARAFLRRLDTGGVAAATRAALTDVSMGLPKPRTPQGPCAHLRNPAAGVEQMADAVLAKHTQLFELREREPDRAKVERKNWWDAIRGSCHSSRQRFSVPHAHYWIALHRAVRSV